MPGIGIGMGIGIWSPNRGAVSAFSPADVAGLELWLDAGQGVTIATGVSDWADQSGKGWAATQGTGSFQPEFIAADANLNGQPSLRFEDATVRMILDMASASSDWTLLAAVYNSGAAGVRALIDDSSGTAFRGRASGTSWQPSGGGASISVTMGVGAHIIGSRHHATEGMAFVDGVETSGTLPALAIGTSILGARFTAGGDWWLTHIAEIIMFKASLSAADLALVKAYLAVKYGVSI